MSLTPAQEQINAFSELAESKVWSARDETLEVMEELYSEVDHTSKAGIVLCFTLAKIYDQLSETDKCFNLLLEGNRNHKIGKTDTIEDARSTVNLVERLFTRQTVNHLKPLDKRRFVFIVGMPRSGTTLVEQILASHSKVFGGGELKLMGQWCFGFLKMYEKFGENALLDNYLPQLRDHYLQGVDGTTMQPVLTDKMPVNFLWIGFILAAFPNARIIHTLRDPMATCWSIYKTPFAGTSNGYSCDMQDIAEFYNLYEQLMEFWRARYPGEIYQLSYENLTENQQQETARLLDYCGLDWEDACLNFHKNPREVRTVSRNQVRQPMYQGSSESWKRYSSHLQPLKQYLESYKEEDKAS